jgi:hypothetical protein
MILSIKVIRIGFPCVPVKCPVNSLNEFLTTSLAGEINTNLQI